MDKSIKKRIKVTSRGVVTTSRGRARSPLGPYLERIGNISVMIVREKATVVEILPDGTEVELNIQNFDKDNTIPVNAEAGKKVETLKAEEKAPNTTQEPTNRQLSRKERKRQEYEKKIAEKQVEPVTEEKTAVPVEVETEPQDTTIPEDAIEN